MLSRRQVKTVNTRELQKLLSDPNENGGLIKKELKQRGVDLRQFGDNTVSKYREKERSRP